MNDFGIGTLIGLLKWTVILLVCAVLGLCSALVWADWEFVDANTTTLPRAKVQAIQAGVDPDMVQIVFRDTAGAPASCPILNDGRHVAATLPVGFAPMLAMMRTALEQARNVAVTVRNSDCTVSWIRVGEK